MLLSVVHLQLKEEMLSCGIQYGLEAWFLLQDEEERSFLLVQLSRPSIQGIPIPMRAL